MNTYLLQFTWFVLVLYSTILPLKENLADFLTEAHHPVKHHVAMRKIYVSGACYSSESIDNKHHQRASAQEIS